MVFRRIEGDRESPAEGAPVTPVLLLSLPSGSLSGGNFLRPGTQLVNMRAGGRRMANESMVLLKNDGVLPLNSGSRITVVGPLADQTAVLLGNYNGTPTHTVSVVEGMKAEFPNAKITSTPGTQFLSNHGDPVQGSALTTPDGKTGLKAEYGSRPGFDSKTTTLASRVDSGVNLNKQNLPEEAKATKTLSVHWSGFLNPVATGDYLLGIKADGFARVSADDKLLTERWGNNTHLGQIDLEKGHPVKLDVSYGRFGEGKREAQLIRAPVNNAPDPAAVAAAKNSDVAVVGITSRLEGEEMPVDQPGFSGNLIRDAIVLATERNSPSPDETS